jgi:hypothetical protein
VKVTLGSLDETWAELAGTIGDLQHFRGLSLTASLRSSDVDAFAAKFGRKLPDIGSLTGTAQLADSDGSIGLEGVELHGGREGTLSIDVSGALDDLRGVDEVDFELRLEAGDLSVIGNLFGVPLPAIGPVEFSGRVAGSDESIASNGWLRLGKTRITGGWSGSFAPGSQPSFAGRIEAAEVFLEDIGLAPRFEGTLGGSAKATELVSEWFRRPLPFELLHVIDLDLGVRAGRVAGRSGFELTGVQGSVKLEHGELVVREATAGYESGAVKALLRIDAGRPVPFVEARGDVRGVDLSRLTSQVKAQAEQAGTVDLGFELRGRGETLEALVADLEGRVEGRLRDGVLASRYAREFMLELAHVSVPSLIPRRSTSVSCFAARLRLEAGRAHVETLLLDSPKVSVTGTGTLDLGENAYRLRLEPRPKDPNLLSVAANVKVTGALAAPEFAPEPLSIATSAVRAIFSNVRRPTRMLREQLAGGKQVDPGCPVDPFTPEFD